MRLLDLCSIACFVVVSAAASAPAPGPAECKASGTAYPPSYDPLPDGSAKNISWATVNLDEPATTRWSKIVAPLSAEIANMTAVVTDTLGKLLGEDKLKATLAKLDANIEEYTARMPHDYGVEVLGIAAATGIEPSVLFVYNLFYTVLGACTSIIGQNDAGEIYHARNLDFGLWPAFNLKDDNFWKLTSTLRPLILNVDVQKGGATLYKATTYAGFVGMHTAMKQGQFALTIDTKFDGNIDLGLIRWITEKNLDHDIDLTWFSRTLFEDYDNYGDALTALNATKMIGPGYVILSGVNEGEGAVVTKGAKKELGKDGVTIDLWQLSDEIAQNQTYFLLQTNYDRTGDAPAFDDRRDPAVSCMHELGRNGTNFNGLFNVLAAKPNLNRLTTFSTLMHTQSGDFEAYRQECVGLDCPLW
jgi:acid ceramidase